VCDLETSRMGAPYIYIYIYDISRLRVKVRKDTDDALLKSINVCVSYLKDLQ